MHRVEVPFRGNLKKACMCFKTRQASTRDYRVCGQDEGQSRSKMSAIISDTSVMKSVNMEEGFSFVEGGIFQNR